MNCLFLFFGCLSHAVQHQKLTFNLTEERQMAMAICKENNEERAKKGLERLPVNETLNKAAQLHAERMRDHDFIDHKDPVDARFYTPQDRVVMSGGNRGPVSENLAQLPALDLPDQEVSIYVIDRAKQAYSLNPKGKIIPRHTPLSFAKSALKSWLKSPGHRQNVLNPENRAVGCGAAYVFSKQGPPMINAVTVFGGKSK